jgi:uncharacterized protein
MTTGALIVGVADLLRRSGSHRQEHLEVVLDGLRGTGGGVPAGEPVTLDLRLQSVNAGIVATGTVSARWEGECRRCLRPVTGRLEVAVQEVFEAEPIEGETSKLDVDRIDLEPLARESILLELPLAPLCRDDCAGLCPVCGADRAETALTGGCGHEEPAVDLRWAALDEIRFDA